MIVRPFAPAKVAQTTIANTKPNPNPYPNPNPNPNPYPTPKHKQNHNPNPNSLSSANYSLSNCRRSKCRITKWNSLGNCTRNIHEFTYITKTSYYRR